MQQLSLKSILIIFSLTVFATQSHAAGMFVSEVSTHAKSRGGALIANPRAPSAAWLNPAALAFLKGTQLQLHLNAVGLNSSFKRNCGTASRGCGPANVERTYGNSTFTQNGDGRSPVDENADPPSYPAQEGYLGQLNHPSDFSDGHTVTNQNPWMAVPTMFASFSGAYFNVPNLTLAVSFSASSSNNSNYGVDEYTRYTLVKKDLIGGYYGMSAAYQLTSWLAIGGSFQGQTLGTNQSVTISADPLGIENPDADVLVDVDIIKHGIPTGNIGLWLSPYKGVELGFSYQHGAEAELSGPVKVSLGPDLQELVDNGLLALEEDAGGGMAYASMVQPAMARGGLMINTAQLFNMPLDIDVELAGVYEMWSVLTHLPLRIEGLAMQAGSGEPEPFDPIVMPKDYQDAYSIRLGTEWRLLQKTLALSAGGFYESSAIPNETLSVDTIDGDKYGAGLGVAYQLGNINLELAYQGIFFDERIIGDESIVHNVNVMEKPQIGAIHENGATRVAMGTYNATYHIISVGITGVFGAAPQPTTPLSSQAVSPEIGTGFDNVTIDKE